VFTLILPRLFRGSFDADPERIADVMALDEGEAIRDRGLLIKSGLVLAAVFTAFVGHSVFGVEPSVVALLGAGVLVMISGLRQSDYLSAVEWETLLFFVGLFVMIGALVKTGVIERLAELATDATGGKRVGRGAAHPRRVRRCCPGSSTTSRIVATMSPLVADLAASIDDPGLLRRSVVVAGIGGGLRRKPDRRRG